MKKIKSCFILLMMMVSLTIFSINLNSKEDIFVEKSHSYENIGYYVVTQSVSSSKKMYIDKSIVNFIKSTRREVYEENNKYYYYASPYVDKVVSIREIGNDIDSIIFMVNELENRAKEKNSKPSKYKNLCLGYLRSINASYADSGSKYGSKWGIIAGNTDESFVKEINNDYSHGLRFNEFFSQFINYSDYNVSLHGELDAKYRRSDDSNPALRLIDPQGKKKKIDLIHMFASIDGIYCKTENDLSLGRNNAQRDIVNWNGDLQTAAKNLKYNIHNLNYNTSNFYDIMNANIGCSEDDILADIDAMNVTKGYLDIDENSLADSLTAYYAIVKTYPFRRFTMFMYTATIEVEHNNIFHSKPADAFLALKEEIYFQFNLEEKKDGSIINKENYIYEYVGNYIMTENCKSMPSKEIRELITKNFIKYLKANITQAEC